MSESNIEFAWVGNDVAVIRLEGRGNFENSIELQRITDYLRKHKSGVKLIIDMDQCTTMDSTFMGTIAGISTDQNKAGAGYVTVVNTHKHTDHLLRNLGLSYILDIREQSNDLGVHEKDFQKVAPQDKVSKFEQIVHMIKAHEKLIDIDNENEVRFQSVLKYLEQSLDREKEKKEP